MSVIRPGCVLWNEAGRCPAMIAAAVGSNARPLTLQQSRQLATSARVFEDGRCPGRKLGRGRLEHAPPNPI